MVLCKICGKDNCKKHTLLLGKTIEIKEFAGSSPPEIFVGKWDYPNVYTGILSPQEYGNTKILSCPELWHANKLEIPQILKFRESLIYGRTKSNIKKAIIKNPFVHVFQEVAMTSKSVATEFKLAKPIIKNQEKDEASPIINNAANIKSVKLQENPKIEKKVDYLTSDKHAKAVSGIIELDKSSIETSTIIKILSAGLLGIEKNRKLVPTRWSITAVDDTLSKEKLKRIKYYPSIQEIQVFNAEYLGNHYEFLLLPEEYSFEVIEISIANMLSWQDYESFFPRKTYAQSVTGAYYANRLALTEYLERIKGQAKCLVMRQVSQEYSAPLGVGILRQTSREAFSKIPEKFQDLNEALETIQSRLKISIKNYTEKSKVLKSYGKQKKLFQFI